MVETQRSTINRLETTRLIGPLVDRYWRELREAKTKGEKVGWCSGPLFIFPFAMSMKCHFMAGYAAYCAGRGAADEVFEIAESAGELRDTCSYHRLHMGMAAAVKDNIPVREDVILPLPDIMIDGRACPEMSHYAEALHRRMGTRVVGIDIPPANTWKDVPQCERYVERQFREILIPTLEEICQKPFDYDKMTEILTILKKVATIRNQCWEFFRKKPSPWSLWDYGVSIAPVFYMMGDPETIPYYEKLLAELKDRADKNIASIEPERYRVYWDGWLPWAFLGIIIRNFYKYGALPICGRYPWEFFPHPETIEPEPDPVKGYVRQLYTHGMVVQNTPQQAKEFIAQKVEEYKLDALIMLSSRTCRAWNIGQQDMVNYVEKKVGVPGILIDSDMVDSRFLSQAQVDTRINALFELVDGRRKMLGG